jgi:aminoglycoside phosphotransferase (APT) family kinase protein
VWSSGSRAIDTLPAWNLFGPEARAAYRDALQVDDAAWERGKGWALQGVYGIVYYRNTNRELAANQIRAIEAVLSG